MAIPMSKTVAKQRFLRSRRVLRMQCGGKTESDILLAAMRPGETPVPIPNTTVKTGTADGTMLETAWESRWLPDSKRAYSSAG